MKMIYKSILVFLALVLMYSLFVQALPIKKFEPINQNQGNIVSKEEFIFNKSKTSDYLIVGSSLAYRMKNNMLPDNYWNLAQGGGTIFKGLDLINQSPNRPKTILIETNIIDRNAGKSTDAIHPVGTYVKRFVPITQQKHQPITYAINLVYQMVGLGNNKAPQTPVSTSKAQKVMDELQEENYSKDMHSDSIAMINMNRLQQLVNDFQEEGTCVIFFEMPISCNLDQLLKSTSTRALMKQYFPEKEFHYLPQLDCQDFNTTDGIHLDGPSAQKMLDYVVKRVEKVDCN